jgi:outer membrane protein assembly factor BamE (lipoprotein component of BamABCDE complex)
MATFRASVLPAVVLAAAISLLAACGTTAGYKQLTATEVAKISAGQTKEEVRASLGQPTSIEARNRRGQEVWTYQFYDSSQIEPHRLLWVYFDPATGKVVRTGSGDNASLDPDAGS